MPFRTLSIVGALAMMPALELISGAPQQPQRPLRVGETVSGRLDSGREVVREFALGADSTLTLHLRSFDFDPRVVLMDADGGIVAEDDDGGLATNARLTATFTADTVYRVIVTGEGKGAYELALERGRPADRTGAVRRDLEIEFHAHAEERAAEHGDSRVALGHRIERGSLLFERGELERARQVLEPGLEAAAQTGDRVLEARAACALGETLLELGFYDDARARLERALAGGDESELGIRTAIVLARLDIRSGNVGAAADRLDRADELLASDPSPALSTRVLFERAAIARIAARRAEAADLFDLAREGARTLGDRTREARALTELGGLSAIAGDLVGARDELEGAVGHARWSGDCATEALALALSGYVHQQLGSVERSDELTARARELVDATGSQWSRALILRMSAAALRARGDSLGALQYRRAEFEVATRVGSPWLEAQARQGLARLLLDMGRANEAREHVRRALELARDMGYREVELLALGDLGILHWYAPNLVEAGRAFETQRELARELKDRRGQANATSSLAAVRFNQGETARAIELALEALDGYREVDDRAGQVNALTNLGDFERTRGDLLRSRKHYEEAVRLCDSWGMGGRPSRAIAGLGGLAHDVADYARAEAYYRRALQIELANGGPIQEPLGRLADVRCHLGDYEATRELASRILDEGGPMEPFGLTLLGRAAVGMRELDRAYEYFERAIELHRERGDESRVGPDLSNLAAIALELGDVDRAVELAEERLALARARSNPTGQAAALSLLAASSLVRGEAGRAEELCRESLDLCDRHGLVQMWMQAAHNLAKAELERGEVSTVRRLLERTERILDGPATHDLESVDAAQWRALVYDWARTAQELVALELEGAGDRPRARRRVLQDGLLCSGRWKSRGLLEGIVEHREGARTKEALALRRERRDAQAMRDRTLQQLAKSLVEGGSATDVAELREEADEWEAKVAELERSLAEASPRDAAVDLPRGVGPEVIRAEVLVGRGALIEYAEGFDRLYAYVLDDAGLHQLDLGSLDAVEELVERYFAHLSDPGHGSLDSLAESGRAAYDTLLAPALALLETEVERLIVVPTTRLARLPFEALVLPEGRAGDPGALSFVIDRWSVVYGPSAPVLAELARHPPREQAGRVLVLADPRYPGEAGSDAEGQGESGDNDDGAVTFGGLKIRSSAHDLARLPKTREEAFSLTRALLAMAPSDDASAVAFLALQDQRSGALSASLFDLYLGAEASPERLDGDLRTYSVLHFAAHGYVDGENARNTGIALAFDAVHDGYFTIADALELDLDADLVVLSACSTARGNLRAGLGVQSMARAFMYAGARGVVASLWQVEDSAAAETMTRFYDRLLRGGVAPDRALREAKLIVRRGTGTRGVPIRASGTTAPSSHPYYWAPFVYLGVAR